MTGVLEALSPAAVLVDQDENLALAGGPETSRLRLGADEAGLPLFELCQDVLTPVLIEVGGRWERRSLRVRQEHEISEVAREVVAELTVHHARPRPTGRPIRTARVAGERHDLGLRMIIALLRVRVAPGDLREALQAILAATDAASAESSPLDGR